MKQENKILGMFGPSLFTYQDPNQQHQKILPLRPPRGGPQDISATFLTMVSNLNHLDSVGPLVLTLYMRQYGINSKCRFLHSDPSLVALKYWTGKYTGRFKPVIVRYQANNEGNYRCPAKLGIECICQF